MYYQGVGAVGALANGKVFTASARKDAVRYNAGKKGQLGWKADISGDALADIVFTLQAYLFTDPREADGKLGPKTNTKIKAFASNNQANASVPYADAVKKVVGGAAPTMINDNVAATMLQANGIEAGVRGTLPTPARRIPRQPGPTVPGGRPVSQASKSDNDLMLYAGVALLGLGVYFYMQKK